MRIAVLADIHGNLPALEAVITQIDRLQPDFVLVNGDLINGAPFSSQVVETIRTRNWVVVRGNHEFYYLDFGTVRAPAEYGNANRWGMLHWLVKRMTPAQGAYLATLPDELTIYLPGAQPLRVAHGVPGHNRTGFRNEHSDEHIAAAVDHVNERTLISAHTHVQIDRQVERPLSIDSPHPRRWHVVNPGAVGLPLSGNPNAHFALLESVGKDEEADGWRVHFHSVAYDRRPLLESYHSSGMLEQGGVVAQLFYWEIVTARSEVVRFLIWAHQQGYDAEDAIDDTFRRYQEATGRAQYVRERDPLHNHRD
jgi:predicted phosphodiesterase